MCVLRGVEFISDHGILPPYVPAAPIKRPSHRAIRHCFVKIVFLHNSNISPGRQAGQRFHAAAIPRPFSLLSDAGNKLLAGDVLLSQSFRKGSRNSLFPQSAPPRWHCWHCCCSALHRSLCYRYGHCWHWKHWECGLKPASCRTGEV